MDNLTKLATDYKKTKSQKALNDLFNCLLPTINKKADFIYYHKRFKFGTRFFTLHETKLVDKEDIRQELSMEVLSLVNNYKVGFPFKNYFYATLWKWIPDSINKEFLTRLAMTGEVELSNGDYDNESPLEALAGYCMPDVNKFIEIEELDSLFTEREKEIIDLFFINPSVTQEEVANKLNVTQPTICKELEGIRQKILKNKE
jgi:RNA polymerase sigma factor (sigma-70 family)